MQFRDKDNKVLKEFPCGDYEEGLDNGRHSLDNVYAIGPDFPKWDRQLTLDNPSKEFEDMVKTAGKTDLIEMREKDENGSIHAIQGYVVDYRDGVLFLNTVDDEYFEIAKNRVADAQSAE